MVASKAGAEGGTQRSKEAHEQGDHRAIVHDGEPCRSGPLSISSTVGKQVVRMAAWRTTGL
jgi:hypothetical protein